MIDLRAIRPHRGSQNSAFEELVCQLARRQPPSGAKEFRRIEGAGGDGGVEGLWLLHDGSEVGVQAKYFLKSGDIDWGQIDKSVSAALAKRPNLKVYKIALACDLTDRKGVNDKAKGGWDAWDARVTKWKAEAAGRSIEFEPLTASDIFDALARPTASGLTRFWFGSGTLSLEWFRQQVETASLDLGERYTPDQHVEIAASAAFAGLARTTAFRQKLRGLVREACAFSLHSERGFTAEVLAAGLKIDCAQEQLRKILCESEKSPSEKWSWEDWRSKIEATEAEFLHLGTALRSQPTEKRATVQANQSAKSDALPTEETVASTRYYARKAEAALEELDRFFVSSAARAEATRSILIVGEAGTGKSHLLAAEANKAIGTGSPAILLLGQQIGEGEPWGQILNILDLSGWSRDELLGALDAAGESAGVRTLICLDAVNEGGGAVLWRSHLAGFVEQVSRYPNLGLALACRSEYVRFALPEAIASKLPNLRLHGFSTFEEQEAAAIQYLDKRGIVRPAGPFLSPEFSNPLFLKAASDALLRKGQKVFPKGLRGVLGILLFYLGAVGANLTSLGSQKRDFSKELKRALEALSSQMAASQQDFVLAEDAERIVSLAFGTTPPPQALSWLEILLRNGVLRKDPSPMGPSEDAFNDAGDVVRLAFQRFQDHLVVRSVMAGLVAPEALFQDSGRLEWLVENNNHYRWPGLLEALAIQVADQFGVELVDTLPGGEEAWWDDWNVQHAFAESVRWRSPKSSAGQVTFTDRTRELADKIDHIHGDPGLRLALEVAVDPAHPWNADRLHRILLNLKLPVRDEGWSQALAFEVEDEEYPLHRIVTWANQGRLQTADDDVLQLAAVVLTWTFSLTNREVRDQATRGLIRILRVKPSVFGLLLKQFRNVDDPYVVERLLAAGYGTACHLEPGKLLSDFAIITFNIFFENRAPPAHLLIRDYALGIIEVAAKRGCFDPERVVAARPPFAGTPNLRFPSKAALKKKKEKVGDLSIYSSCDAWGDFGRYEIASATGHFSATPLTQPRPLTDRHKADIFFEEVIRSKPGRISAFNLLEDAVSKMWSLEMRDAKGRLSFIRTRVAEEVGRVEEAENALLALLDADEKDRYVSDAQKEALRIYGSERASPATFSSEKAQRWITNKAYDLGWNRQRFGDDRVPTGGWDRQRSRTERIGKKYQWIALQEFLARLSDTHWLAGDWGEVPREYRYPTDVGFQRDIDPTLPAMADVSLHVDETWWRFEFDLPTIDNEGLKAWVAGDADWQKPIPAVFREDHQKNEWITLNSFQLGRENHEDDEFVPRQIGTRREAFLFVQSGLLRKADYAAAYRALTKSSVKDRTRIEPNSFPDGPFWGEYPWRDIWPTLGETTHDLPKGTRVTKPVVEYVWESHLDASLSDSQRLYLPAPLLIQEAQLLFPILSSPHVAHDTEGNVAFASYRDGPSFSTSMRREIFDQMLGNADLSCIWFIFGERSAWPDGKLDTAPRRWFASVIGYSAGKLQTASWERPW